MEVSQTPKPSSIKTSIEKIQHKLYSTLLNIQELFQILKHHIEIIREKFRVL